MLEQYAALGRYNRWMNARIYEVAARLSDEERKRDLGAFFKSLHGTLNHLLLADRVWLGRFTRDRAISDSLDREGRLIEIQSLAHELYPDFDDLRREREKTDSDIEKFVLTLGADRLTQPLTYKTGRGEPCDHPFWWALSHFFNHQTHHRGQATALLTRLGYDPGVTDFIYFLRTDGALN